MDGDIEPEPCRDCMTPIPPGWGWCAECERKRKQEFCPWCHLPYDGPPGMGCQLPHG